MSDSTIPTEEETFHRSNSILDRACALIESGALDEAEALLDEAGALAEEIEVPPAGSARYFEILSTLHDARDFYADGTAALKSAGAWLRTALDEDDSVELARKFASNRAAVAKRLESVHDHAQASAVLDESIGRLAPFAAFDAECAAALIEARIGRAWSLISAARYDEALPVARAAVATADSATRARAHAVLGELLALSDDCAGSVDALRIALDAWTAAEHDPSCPGVATARARLATELVHTGRDAEAIDAFKAFIAVADNDVTGEDAMQLAAIFENFAATLEREERCAEAADASARMADLALLGADFDDDAPFIAAHALNSRALSLLHVGRTAEAHEALDRVMTLADGNRAEVANMHLMRAHAFESEEKFDRAVDAAHAAVEVWRVIDESRPRLASALTEESKVRDRNQDGEGALACAEEAIAIWETIDDALASGRTDVAAAHEAHAEAFLTLQQCTEAVSAFGRAIAICSAPDVVEPATLRGAARVLGRRAGIVADHGDCEAALRDHAESVAIYRRLAAKGDARAAAEIPKAMIHRAALLSAAGDDAAALGAMDAATHAAREQGGEVLTYVLEVRAKQHRDRGEVPRMAACVAEAAELLRDRIAEGNHDCRSELFAMAAEVVTDFADAGEAEPAARLLACCVAAGAPDGRSEPQAWQSMIASCRQLAAPQVRRIRALMPDGGASLRMLLGRG